MAAGRGTRMRSDIPKVLHRVCGKPMLEWVVDAGREAGADRIVCVVRPGDGVAEGLPEGVELAEQTEGEGTGSAVLAARAATRGRRGPGGGALGRPPARVGRAPHRPARASTARTAPPPRSSRPTGSIPTGYGRIVRNGDGSVERIVETKHPEGVPEEELAIREINLGTYAFEPEALVSALDTVASPSGERYLTGAISVLSERDAGHRHLPDRRRQRRPRRERPRRPDAGRGGGPGADPRAPRPRRA